MGTIIGIKEELTSKLVPGVPDLLACMNLLVDDADSLPEPISDEMSDVPILAAMPEINRLLACYWRG